MQLLDLSLLGERIVDDPVAGGNRPPVSLIRCGGVQLPSRRSVVYFTASRCL